MSERRSDGHGKPVFAVTFDTDWAPQFVVDHVLGLLVASGLPGTVFCTGPYAMPAQGRIEVALHPNLMGDSTQGNGAEDVLVQLKRAMPQAVGVRTHRLFWHGGLLGTLAAHGLVYDSSLLVPLQLGLRPFRHKKLVRMPIWWSDNVHFDRDFALDGFAVPGLDEPGLKVLLFHPLQIYLNAPDAGHARIAMSSTGALADASPEELEPHRFRGNGMETVFRSALDFLATSGAEVRLLKECVADAR